MKQKCLIYFAIFSLVGCTPISPNIKHQYAIKDYATYKYSKAPHDSILVNKPTVAAGYTTNEMQYIKKPYELTAFSHNAWIDPPADMLLTIMGESLQDSNRFKAVATSPMAENTNYRIDSQLISINQNFITKPSTLDLKIKLVITDVITNKVIRSKVFSERISCPEETPYGGVIAANLATKKFTAEMMKFILSTV